MPALDTVVTDYLDRIKNSLTVGVQTADPGSGNITAAPVNYLRAQDMATVLELLQNALDAPTLTAGGENSTTSVGAALSPDYGATDSQVGNVVVFDGNVTASLAGLERVITSNDANTLNFAALPEAPASGDTFSIRGEMASPEISVLRGGLGRGRADAPGGSVYGSHAIAMNALMKLGIRAGGLTGEADASAVFDTLAFGGNLSFGEAEIQLLMLSPTTARIVDMSFGGDPFPVSFRIDELKGLVLAIGTDVDEGARTVVRNTETEIEWSGPLSFNDPTSAEAEGAVRPGASVNPRFASVTTHPGAQSGDNARLSQYIQFVEDTVTNYQTPTDAPPPPP